MRVLLGISHALLREGLRDVLKRWKDVEVVGVCPSVAEATRRAERTAPDALLFTRSSRPAEDARALEVLKQRMRACKLVLIEEVGASMRDDLLPVDWRVSPGVGAAGLVRKLWELCAPDAQNKALSSDGKDANGPPPVILFTAREYDVLCAVCDGLSNKDIARRLNIADKTVKNHLSSIYRRTKVNGRTQLVLWALARGLGTVLPPSASSPPASD